MTKPNPSGELSEEQIAALKSQKPELIYIDALGRGRYSREECDEGVARFVMGGGTVYWPLSPEDADRLHQSCCGEGRFDGPNVAELAALKAERDALSKDSERLDWLDQNIFSRENLTFNGKLHPDLNMWVMFAPKGHQGTARNILDAAMANE